MNSGALFYSQPRLVTLVLAIIIAGGLSALLLIPQQEDPRITARFAVIVTPFPGASAERVEKLVTDPLENELRELGEIKTVRSASRAGISVVNIELADWVADPTPVFSEARDKVDDAARDFPAGAQAPLFDDDRTHAFTMLVSLSWRGQAPPNRRLLVRYAEELQDRLRQVPDTDIVTLHGVPEEEIRVTLKPEAVTQLAMNLGGVSGAIANADAKTAAGVARGAVSELNLEVEGELDTLDRLAAVPVRVDAAGRAVRLGELADIDRAIADPPTSLALIGGREAVVVAARMQGGVRIQQWEAAAQQVLDDFRRDLSAGIAADVIFNQRTYTDDRFAGLVTNLLIGVSLVVSVLLITLGFRAAVLVAAALPVAGLMTLIALDQLSMPLHQMSVTGMIVALGLVVDAAIVMVDAIQRRLTNGLSPFEAVRQSVSVLWLPLLSSTLTTVLGFTPLLLLAGPVGEFVGGIGIAVVCAVIASFAAALTLTPALTGRWLGHGGASPPPSLRFWRGGLRLPALTNAFRRSLELSLRFPLTSMLGVTILPALGFVGATTLTSQFFPASDRNQAQVELRLPEQSTIDQTLAAAKRAHTVITAVDGIERADWFIGESAPKFYYNLPTDQDGSPHYAQAQITFAALQGIENKVRHIQAELDRALPQTMPLVRLLEQGPPTFAPIEIRIYGQDAETLIEIGERARRLLSEIPGVSHTRATDSAIEPKLWVDVQEDAANRAGLPLQAVAQQLRATLDGATGGSILEGEKELPVRVRAPPALRGDLDAVASLGLTPGAMASTAGAYPGLPVAALGTFRLEPSPGSINHYQGERVNIIAGYTLPGTLPAEALTAFKQRWAKAGAMPPGYRLEYGGESEARSDAVANLASSLGLIVTGMVAVIVLAFNSFRLAGIIFGVALMAVGLGLLSLTAFGFPFGFQPIIGLIGAIGVAVNDAIIVLSALKANDRAARGDIAAMVDTVTEGSRHIVSTTLTTTAGFLPLILSSSKFWPPFATAIAGAVLLSSVVAFYFVPPAFAVVYARRRHADTAPSRAGAATAGI